MRPRLALALSVLAALPFSLERAEAQALAGVRVVASCGSTAPFPAPGTGTTFSLMINAQGQLCSNGSGGGSSSPFVVSHAQSAALGSSLAVKASAGDLLGFNCTSITGAAAGFCVAINSTTIPSPGAAIAPLDFCYFDTTPRGCSLGRSPSEVAYSAGIQVLITTAASPFTYTTGTDTAVISADFQ